MSGSGSKVMSVTFCGLMAALGVVIMLIGGVIGVGTYAAPLLASVCLIPMRREFGTKYALMGFAVTAVLTVLLCAEKELAFFYAFVGWYPLAKPALDRIPSRPIKVALKLVIFACAVAAMYAFLYFLLKPQTLIEEFAGMRRIMLAAFFAGLVLTLLVYDFSLRLAFFIYEFRLRPRLRFLK